MNKLQIAIRAGLVLILAMWGAGCAPVITGGKEITSFTFKAADNAALTTDVVGAIVGTSISVSMPFTVDRAGLVPTFVTTGSKVEVGGAPQTSGVTANNYTSTVEYEVTGGDGSSSLYVVDATVNEHPVAASDATSADSFGYSVAIDGDYAVVGAYGKASQTGAAYIFHRTDTNSWDSGTRLDTSSLSLATNDQFGYSVSISGDYAIVGAWATDSGKGAAYVYHRTVTGWDSVAELVSLDVPSGAHFGLSVSINGSYAIVGAHAVSTYSGAAYVFHRTATNTWDTGAKLVPSDPQTIANFGASVGIGGDYAIVGAHTKGTGGEAYMFHRTDTNIWDAGVKLTASDAASADYFGHSVSIDGDYAIVGADFKSTGTGAAYIFNRTGTNLWDSVTKLVATDAANSDHFGCSVTVDGDGVLVGANAKNSTTGAAYAFNRTGTNTWICRTKLLASDAATGDNYGISVCLSGNYAILGAHARSSNTGVAYILK